MNVIALMGAAIGLAILVISVVLGNKIQNRILRYLAAAVGIIISIVVASNVPAILGDNNTATSAKAGEYMMYLALACIIIKAIFFRKKKVSSS